MRDSRGGLVVMATGEVSEAVDTSGLTAPTLLVAPVTDALKVISADGLVEDHVDRESTWLVVGYFLDDQTSHLLATERVPLEKIHERVLDLVGGWATHPVEGVV